MPDLPPKPPQLCEFEPGCKNLARKLVGAALHSGPDGTARAWICEQHLSTLKLDSPFSKMAVLAVLPE